MDVYKCEMPGCNEYITEDELKRVKYNCKIITICSICDDDSYELINGGGRLDKIEKIEKIRRNKKQYK